jgi:hypothetical protein
MIHFMLKSQYEKIKISFSLLFWKQILSILQNLLFMNPSIFCIEINLSSVVPCGSLIFSFLKSNPNFVA